MKNKTFIIYSILSCAALATIGALSFSNQKVNISSSADPTVPHEIKFTYEDISFFEMDDVNYECIAEVSKTTDAGNTFRSSDITIKETYYTNPVKGDSEHNYLFKLENGGYPYYAYNAKEAIYIEFQMNLDVAGPVTAIVNRTCHYNDGENQSNSTESEDFLELDNVDNKYYGLGYTYEFDNQYYDYVTINYIQINYSCSY